jgi:hypothetical protein
MWNDAIIKKFPTTLLSVQWAYTGIRQDYEGGQHHAALMAETWLLECYRDSYCEFPPLNEKG